MRLVGWPLYYPLEQWQIGARDQFGEYPLRIDPLYQYTVVAEAAPFDLRGGAAILKYELATAGSVGAAGPLPSLSTLLEPVVVGYTLTADAAAFALSGQDATLLRAALLTADAGAFSVAGQDAGLKAAWRLDAGAGAYTLEGQPATLFKPGAYTLNAEPGDFVLTGGVAQLVPLGVSAVPVSRGGGGPIRLREKRREPVEEFDDYDDVGLLVGAVLARM